MDFSLTRLLFRSFFVMTISANAKEVTIRNTNASGNDSLRDAISAAEPGDTLVFIPSLNGQTISLGGNQLDVTVPLTIDASALSSGITIDAQGSSRVLRNIAQAIRLGGEDLSVSQSTIGSGFSVFQLKNGNFTDFTETLPSDPNPAITLSLLTDPTVGYLKIYNRGDGTRQDRLSNITVTLLDVNDNTLWTSQVLNPGNRLGFPSAAGETSAPLTVALPPIQARKIRISKPNPSAGGEGADILSVGEVEVFPAGTVLKNLTLTGGKTFQGGESFAGGGGILNNGSLALMNCSVLGNTTGKGLDGNEGTPGATGPTGNAGPLGGGSGGEGGNAGAGADGGGIYNNGILSISESTIARNSAGDGGKGGAGGIGGDGGGGGDGGEGSFGGIGGPGGIGGFGGKGGAIYNSPSAILAISTSTIAENEAGTGGNAGDGGRGGDGLKGGGNGGQAGSAGTGGDAGGIFNRGELSVTFGTVYQNEAGLGGRKANGGDAGKGTEAGAPDGTAGTGGEHGASGTGDGVTNESLFAFANSIIAGDNIVPNFSTDIAQLSGILIASENNLISNTFRSGLTGGEGIIVANPGLRPLGDYGGPTLTALPIENSPVAGQGTGSPRTRDQRGPTRNPFGGESPELGAVEYQGAFTEFDIAFDLDSDGDGHKNGLEEALGTNPYLPDAANSNNLSIRLVDGKPTLTFGYRRADIDLKLVRSTDFMGQVTVAFSGPGMDFTASDISLIEIEDFPQTPSQEDKAFYWLEASRQP